MIEQMRWHVQSIPDEEYAAVKGLPADWTPKFIRAEMTRQMDLADAYIMSVPVELVGLLALNKDGVPIEVTADSIGAAVLRKPTEEPDIMPAPAEFGAIEWGRC
jgi:hypothetical protein